MAAAAGGSAASGERGLSVQATVLSTASLGLVLAHVLVDQHIGLWGETSTSMSGLQAANVAGHALLFAWWTLVIAWARRPARPGAPLAATVLVAVEALLLQGLVAVAACPPPCAGAFPYQDVVHVAIVAVAGWASWTAYRDWRATARGSERGMTWVTVGVILVSMALSAPLSIQVLTG